jgi:GDP-L-fucose synthase
MNKSDTIYVAGHSGLVGSAILRRLRTLGYERIISRSSRELDLRNQASTTAFFEHERPRFVFLAAAKVGGIMANSTYRADFIYDNLLIGANVIEASRHCGVSKLINLGSSCIYPKLAPQPLREEHLLTGPLEPTNEPYAVAKIAIVKLCRYFNEQHGTNFISVMPTNLYGPGDNFDSESSHVLPALMSKIHRAKEGGNSVEIWGDGTPMREFLYVDDLAEALVFLMERYDASQVGEIINIGSGIDCSIRTLAETIARVVGYHGEFVYDPTKPNGTPRKLLDVSRLRALGWEARTSLEEGIQRTYRWFLDNTL